jgi:ADP-dependent NAD(P)H-hydrate dehydratase / NAD(P)H-hydrate epimerase
LQWWRLQIISIQRSNRVKVSTVDEIRSLDKQATENFGIPEDILMENAGLSMYFVITKEFEVMNKNFLVFCGAGNNGGDGLVVARKLHSSGAKVKIFLLANESKFKGAAKKNFEIVSKMPLEIYRIVSVEDIESAIQHSDAIVDAILGTGLTGEVSGLCKDVIQMINESHKTVFSLDIPSGISGDTGKLQGIAIRADYTVTFGLPKIGNIFYPGYKHCGKLYVSHISFPPSLYNIDSIKVEISNPSELPERNESAHKGDFSEVLFIAGASSYFGAPYFSALSFLKSGGGYSRLATPTSISPFLASKGSEIVFIPQSETTSGSIALKNKNNLLSLSENMDMIVIGPGLSLNEETQQLVQELTLEIQKPLLLDGDGITAISKNLELIKKRKAETIITPHLGEMARIAGMNISELNENKIVILRKMAKELNAIIVLKGAHSLIGYPDETIYINMSGNSGMATAGSGDVLTGTIAGIAGQGLSLKDAVKTGVFIHGLSGDLAAADKGEDGITAQDIMDYLPASIKLYRENYDDILQTLYNSVWVI